MAEDLSVGDRVKVVEIRDGKDMPEGLVGLTGVVEWITTGFDGERGYVEVKLDDGRVLQFQNKEVARA